MNLEKLFSMQKVLDERIVKEKQLRHFDLLPQKILALQVELGELANEVRCFKFWSNKPASDVSVVLEEYVDCLHFILSIGNELKQTKRFGRIRVDKEKDLTDQFRTVFYLISEPIITDYPEGWFNILFSYFVELGEMLCFTWEEVEQAYLKKNEVNHQRQDSGVY